MASEFKYITKPKNGRRIVIGDIHGCSKTLNSLLWKQIKLTHQDQLFFLGDYIDRGPRSKKVVDTIIKLKKENYSIFPLRGNHENNILHYNKGEFRFLYWYLRKNKQINFLKKGELKKKYRKFFEKLSYYYILDNYFLVHAGFDIKSGQPFKNKEAFTEIRKMKYNSFLFDHKKIITGHQPTPLSTIIQNIKDNKSIICIDNGAVYKGKKYKYFDTSEMGNLIALELDTFKLYIQNNID